jgi:hypothetical protein
MPVILATQAAEISRMVVQRQPWANSSQDPILQNPSWERAGGMAQGVGTEFKAQYQKNKQINKN